MRQDRHEKKKSGGAFRTFTKIWSIFYILVTIAFFSFFVYMDVLAMKYVCMAAGLIVVILILTFPALFFKRFKNSRRIISLIISIALIGAYGAGIVYINGTIDFMDKVTTVKEQTEPYYVLAKADSSYDGAESVRGKTVQTFLTNEINYSEAKNMLQEETGADLSALASGVLDETYELIFISEAHYTTMCSENTNFKEGSKIIHTVKVPIEVANIAKDVNVTEDSFNIYVSGLDTEGAIDVVSRSDVNMIVTVNPKAHKVLLTSIPRDYYLELPNTDGAKDKLTHTGVHGINETVAAIEKLTGLDMNYYVKVNYTTVTSLVDAIGGIDVESDYTFVTHGMGVYYEFYEGSNYLDGARALAFARERKSFSDGDLQRNKNQQKVLEGILKKALSSTTILTRYTAILDAIEDCVEINMSQEDIRRLIKMQTDGMPSWDIEKQSIVGVSSSEVCYLDGMNIYASVVLQNPESIVSAVDRIIAVMEDGRE